MSVSLYPSNGATLASGSTHLADSKLEKRTCKCKAKQMGSYKPVVAQRKPDASGQPASKYEHGSKALTDRIDTLYNHEYDRSMRKVVVSRTKTTECKRILALDDQACRDALSELIVNGTPTFWIEKVFCFVAFGVPAVMVYMFVSSLPAMVVEAKSFGEGALASLKSWVFMLIFTAVINAPLMWHCAGRFWCDKPSRRAVTIVMTLLPFVFGILLDKWNPKVDMEALWVLPALFAWTAWVVTFEVISALDDIPRASDVGMVSSVRGHAASSQAVEMA